jgi:AcrR family transcriptional regulator
MDNISPEFSIYSILGEDYALPLGSGKIGTKEHILVYSTVLFAMHGYTSVSIKDIAAKIGIKAASLYNHFSGKEALWDAVVEHTVSLYRLYHKSLEENLLKANSLEQVLEIIFREPERMANSFSCFAFSLIGSEQFRSEKTWRIYSEIFLDYTASIFSKCFDRCIKLGWAREFDTATLSATIVSFTLQQVSIFTQKLMGRAVTADPRESVRRFRQMLLKLLAPEK